ncbi:MAG: hypothetical protein U0797_10415 [Gemmataceae bacterium]
MSVANDPIMTLALAFGCLLAAVGIIVVALRADLLIKSQPEPEPEKLDDEIKSLEQRLNDLAAEPGTPTWQTTALRWRLQRRLAGLKQRRRRFDQMATRWESRAKAVCLPESLARRPNAIQKPPTNGRAKP